MSVWVWCGGRLPRWVCPSRLARACGCLGVLPPHHHQHQHQHQHLRHMYIGYHTCIGTPTPMSTPTPNTNTNTRVLCPYPRTHRDGNPEVLQAIMNEIEMLHRFNSPYVVNFYGAYISGQVQCYPQTLHVQCYPQKLQWFPQKLGTERPLGREKKLTFQAKRLRDLQKILSSSVASFDG